MIVHHQSGAALVVDELLVRSAWEGVLEGVPDVESFQRTGRDVVDGAFGARATRRLAPCPIPESAEARRRRAAELPAFVCAADVRFDRGAPEGEERAALAWFSGRALDRAVEDELQAAAGISLDEDPAPRPLERRAAYEPFESADGVVAHVQELRVRFAVVGAAHDALAAWLPKGHVVLPHDFLRVDAPVLVRMRLEGPRLPRSGRALPASALRLALVAQSPGAAPLRTLVAGALARVEWNRIATPMPR